VKLPAVEMEATIILVLRRRTINPNFEVARDMLHASFDGLEVHLTGAAPQCEGPYVRN